MSRLHKLKTWGKVFQAVTTGRKTAEYRKNDRNFKVGDALYLMEWDQENGKYMGRSVIVCVTHIIKGGEFGIPKDYCVLSIKVVGALIE